MAQKQGALAKDPTNKLTRVSPGVYRNAQGKLVNSSGRSINSGRSRSNRTKTTQPATPPPNQVAAEQGMQTGFEAYQDLAKRYAESDPYQMQAQYNPVFSQEMERQRQAVMDTFNRRNADEFARQDLATQQQIAERGLDPNSPAAQALMKMNTQRQDIARQEAMSAAETQALGAQQQYYQQAYQTGMAPYAQYEYLQQPFALGMQNFYQQQQAQREQQFLASQQAKQLAAQERIARMRGSGGAPAEDPMNAFYDAQIGSSYGPQGATPNPWASAAQGATAAVGQQITKQR